MSDTDDSLGVPESVRLARLGYGIDEIALITGDGEHAIISELADHGCRIDTPAHRTRVEQRLYQRILGSQADEDGIGGLAPHFQAANLYLASHDPATYGRQAGGQGATINVIVDRDGLRRIAAQSASNSIEGEVIPSNALARK